ncbi:MAG: DUF695 domain-containing protein [Phycisphaerales bacterium]|nr:MAG: DUF695 domain-containing protein [Phycisphaerales bacterium]
MASDELRRRLRPGDDWDLVDGKLDGSPMIARVRTEAAAPGIEAGLLTRVTFEVELDDQINGLPSMSEQNVLDGLEDQLSQLADESGEARLVLLVSGGGKRHMVLYCRNEGWVTTHRDALGVIFSDRVVEIFAEDDPGWTVHAQFVEAAG